MSDDIVERLREVSPKTALRWKRGQNVPPASARMILHRDLGCFDPAWRGWRVSHRGELVSPNHDVFSPGDVLASVLLYAQLSAYRAELAKARAEIAAGPHLDEQPLPGELPAIRVG